MNAVALITGASRGIGRGIAVELARSGFDVVLNFRGNHSAAQEALAVCRASAQANGRNSRAEVCQGDIGKTEDRQNLVTFVRSTFGRLDVLVNNAGVAPLVRTDILEGTEESFDRVLNINVKGPYFLTQLVARWMIEQHAQGTSEHPYRPKVITISSVSAYAASPERGEYCVAKAALSMLTPLYAARLAEHGINVYEIRPGIIATDMTQVVKGKYDRLISEGLTPIRRWGTPEDVARAVGAIAQDALPFSTGEVINVDGGFHIRRL